MDARECTSAPNDAKRASSKLQGSPGIAPRFVFFLETHEPRQNGAFTGRYASLPRHLRCRILSQRWLMRSQVGAAGSRE